MTRRAPAARGGRAPSQRQLRVGEEIRHILAHMVARAEFRDPELAGQSITITEVRVSPDLRNATVFVTPLTGDPTTIVPALQRAAGFLRSQLGAAIKLRNTPSLTFEYDASFDQAERVGAVLQDLQRARAPIGNGEDHGA